MYDIRGILMQSEEFIGSFELKNTVTDPFIIASEKEDAEILQQGILDDWEEKNGK